MACARRDSPRIAAPAPSRSVTGPVRGIVIGRAFARVFIRSAARVLAEGPVDLAGLLQGEGGFSREDVRWPCARGRNCGGQALSPGGCRDDPERRKSPPCRFRVARAPHCPDASGLARSGPAPSRRRPVPEPAPGTPARHRRAPPGRARQHRDTVHRAWRAVRTTRPGKGPQPERPPRRREDHRRRSRREDIGWNATPTWASQ